MSKSRLRSRIEIQSTNVDDTYVYFRSNSNSSSTSIPSPSIPFRLICLIHLHPILASSPVSPNPVPSNPVSPNPIQSDSTQMTLKPNPKQTIGPLEERTCTVCRNATQINIIYNIIYILQLETRNSTRRDIIIVTSHHPTSTHSVSYLIYHIQHTIYHTL